MFCSECGTKNNEGAEFCKECGTKLGNSSSNSVTKKVDVNNFLEFIKKNKIVVAIIGVVLCLIVAYFTVNNTIYSSKKFALNYAKSVISGDMKTQIDNAGVYGKSDFVTKKIVNEKFKNQEIKKILQIKVLSKKEVEQLVSSSISDSTIKSALSTVLGTSSTASTVAVASSLTKTYVVEYIVEGNTKSKYLTVILTKDQNKNLLVFDKWKALDDEVVANDVTVTTNKGDSITVDGVKLTDKYLNKKDSSSSESIYNIGTVLKDDVVFTSVLKNGLVLSRTLDMYDEKNVDLTSYYSFKLDDSSSKKISEVVKKFANAYIGGAVKNEDVANVKKDSSMSSDLISDSYFDTDYNSLVSRYDSDAVTEFEVKDVTSESSSIYNDIMTVKSVINYSYKYTDSSNNVQSKKDKVTITVKFDISSKKLQVNDMYSYNLKYIF